MRWHFHLARVFWEKRDLWVGVFWDRNGDYLDIYICLVPTLPLYIVLNQREQE